NASVSVPTDQAQVAFAMETRAETAAEAASANATAMDRVLSALRASDLPGLDLETFGYSLQPQYSTDQQRVRTIAGYIAQNNVRATVDDVDAVGRLIDAAIGAGANRVASIAFSASDTDEARAQAMTEAVRSARAEAELMAEALGYRLGPPLEIRGGAQRPGPVPMAFATAARVQEVQTPIEAGDQTVTANVTIRFALGPPLDRR
ncbi:MAG: SIMPL domain-containing protein, partial [Gemmatimonadota bacterium]